MTGSCLKLDNYTLLKENRHLRSFHSTLLFYKLGKRGPKDSCGELATDRTKTRVWAFRPPVQNALNLPPCLSHDLTS